MLTRTAFLFFIIGLFTSIAKASLLPDPNYISYKTEDGLSNDIVMSITQDSEGYMWFGTEDGLSRFDGYNFKVYRYEPNSPDGLPGKQVQSLLVDSNNNLWVGTETGGLGLYNKSTDSFVTFSTKQGLKNENIQEITEVDGVLWVSTDVGISLIDVETKEVNNIPFGTNSAFSTNHKWIREITNDDDYVWIGTWGGGLNRYNKSTKKFSYFRHSDDPTSISSDVVYKVHKDKKGNIWAGTLEEGLNRFIPECECFERYLYSKNNSNSILVNGINGFVDDKDGNLWVLTSGGPSVYDVETNQFNNYKLLNHNESGNSHREVVSGFLSRDNTLWIGSHNLGVVSISRDAFRFQVYRYSNVLPNSLEANNIQSIFFRNNQLLTGTDKGLYQYAYGSGGDITLFNQLLGLHVYKISYSPKTKSYWLASASGLYEVSIDLQILNQYDHSKVMPHSLTQGRIHDVIESESGDLFIANWRGGLTKLNLKTREFSYLNITGAKDLGLEPLDLNVAKIVDNTLWVGSRNGIYSVSLGELERVKYFSLKTSDEQPSIAVFHIAKTSHGLLIATDQGVMRLNESEDKFNGYIYELNTRVVQAIAELEGVLWVSTYNGLFKWDKDTNKLSEFYTVHGTQGDVYNPKSIILRDNKLLFGGKSGITAVIDNDDSAPYTTLKWIGVDDSISSNFSLANKIQIPAQPQYVELAYQSNDYSLPESQQFRYKLNGGLWNTQRFAEPIKLIQPASGDYKVELQVKNSNASWIESSNKLQFTITPPWYFTKLAILIYVIFLFATAYILYRARIKSVNQRNKLLQKTIDEKTAELTSILEQKNQLFANISHELRTPITLINTPIEQLAQQSGLTEQQQNLIHLAQNNGKRLFGLVERILHLSKVEQKQKQIEPINIDDLLIRYVIAFEPLMQQKQIELRHQLSSNALLQADKEDLVSILENLLSNALRYTSAGGWVKLYSKELDGEYQFIVENQHTGLSTEQIDKIFDRFERLGQSDSEQGFGLGLSLVRDICNQNDWNINCTSKTDSVVFTLTIIDFEIESGKTSAAQRQIIELGVEKVQSSDKERQSVLIIEDNDELRGFLVDLLSSDYEVSDAANGLQGLELAIESIPDLIISDVMMPELDGFSLVKALAEHDNTSHILTILLTAKADEESELRGLELGAVDYISKPFEARQLLLKVNNTLARLKLRFKAQQNHDETIDTIVSERDQKFIQRLNQLVDKNYADCEFNVEKLVNSVPMSERQLQRKLKAIFNQTPAEYIRNYRLLKAKELLLEGKSISLTSDLVGFNSSSYFSRSFKTAFGQSPKEFITQPSN